MLHVPTGFSILDETLESGIIAPSCICISGKFTPNQRNFILQLTNNFLKNGLKGLYICLDRPAAEIKRHFKQIKLDITAYDKSYSLFFIDFFSYSQKALIETAELRTLEYNPHMLLETISPFLDWIKNGFIIIDSLSTLTLNMDTKEAYDFIRGIKLLGRAFNLIIIGITHAPVADLDLIVSNSDGNLLFKGETLIVDRFEHVNHQEFLLSTDQDGKVALKSPTETENEQTLLSILADFQELKITPTLKLTTSAEIDGSIDEVAEKLTLLEDKKTVKKTPYCSTIKCATCNGQSFEFYLQCPQCESRLLNRGEIIEHFSCGYVDFDTNFKRDDKLVCLKCNKDLKQIGVDYRRVGVGYSCANRHLFSTPRIVFVCSKCKEQFDFSEAKLEKQYIYELTEKGKHQLSQDRYDQNVLSV
ncbi:MAG: hypothetical protein NWE96_05410 [Candidatus Bathyarchaeota archaeon]|nr:hypothetical protein [Candidatus Bathyarchaeota archaeon]